MWPYTHKAMTDTIRSTGHSCDSVFDVHHAQLLEEFHVLLLALVPVAQHCRCGEGLVIQVVMRAEIRPSVWIILTSPTTGALDHIAGVYIGISSSWCIIVTSV